MIRRASLVPLIAMLLTVAAIAAADVTTASLTTMIACPTERTCNPIAIDAAGRFIVYSVTRADEFVRDIFVHDTLSHLDRSVATLEPSAFINARITDDGRYILYANIASDAHAYDTATGATIDFPLAESAGIFYVPTDWSRDLRYVLYGVYRNVASGTVDELVVYDRQLAAPQEIPLNGRTPVSGARLSPDGRGVSYASFTAGGTWIFDRLSGREIRLETFSTTFSNDVSSGATFTSNAQYAIGAGTTYETATGRPVVRSPRGAVSPNGRYVVYRCSQDARDPTFCVYDQVTTLRSRLPSLGDPGRDNLFGGAVVDDLGRVAFTALTPGAAIYMTCGSYFVPPPLITSTSPGMTATVRLSVSSEEPCTWAAQRDVPWMTITSPGSGAGSADLTYVVSTHSGGRARTGTLAIAGQTFVITQGQNPNAAPGAPVSFRAPSEGFGSLIWSAPVDGGPITSYIVEGGSRPGLSDRFRVSTGDATTSAPISTGFRQPALYVRVRASNQFGESIASNEVVVRPPPVSGTGSPCLVPPDAPEGLDATVSGSTVTLRWTGNLPFIGASYIIEAGSVSGLANLANYITGSTAPGLVAPGIPAGTYVVKVRAIDVCGVGRPSSEIVVIVP